MFRRKYSEGWIEYPGKGKITDTDVWNYVKSHTHWWQRLNPRFCCDAAIRAQLVLMGITGDEDVDEYIRWE